jgi:hypothetical protein
MIEDELGRLLRDVCDRTEAGIFTQPIQTDSGPGTVNYTTGPAMPALTMESLMETYRKFKVPELTPDDRAYLDDREYFGQRACLGFGIPPLGPLAGIQVIASEYMGERVQVRFPKAPRGPYQRRRQKRMDRDPRNWVNRGNGEYFLVDGNAIMCHPDDLAKLQAAL